MPATPHPYRPRHRRRLLPWLVLASVLAMLVVGVGWLLVDRGEARAWRQSVTIGAALAGSDAGVAGTVAGWFDSTPGRAQVREAATLPAVSIRPADGNATHPVVVVLVPDGATEAELDGVRDVQRALARAGIAGWALRTPDPGRSLGDDAALDSIAAALGAIADDPGTRSGRIAVAGSGALGSLALVAASRDALAPRIDAVLAVQPVADVQGLVRLAVTGTSRDAAGLDVRRTVAPELRLAAGRAIVQAVRAHTERSAFVDGVLEAAAASPDPIASLAQLPTVGPPELVAAVAVLRARTPAAFDAAWRELPADVQAAADARSPLVQAPRVDGRVLLAVPVDDAAWPAADAERLQVSLRDARLHRSTLLDPGADRAGFDVGELRGALGDGAWWLQRAGA